MAETEEKKETTETAETVETTETAAAAAEKDVMYTADEFAAAAKTFFSTSPDIIRAAFRVAGKTEATKEEAQEIVESFKAKRKE